MGRRRREKGREGGKKERIVWVAGMCGQVFKVKWRKRREK